MTERAPEYRITTPSHAERHLPLIVEAAGSANLARLCGWLRARSNWIEDRLAVHGGLLLRGFAVHSPDDFARIARSIDDTLTRGECLGSSLRNAFTDDVFPTSKLPGDPPIPQPCEMSFTAPPPRRVFFCCLIPPAADSGETPLSNFRRVWSELDPAVRSRFEERGLCIVRARERPCGSQSLDCTDLDGRQIPRVDLEQARDVIWRHVADLPWRRGDVLVIDCVTTADSPLPDRRPRPIPVCWA